MPTNTLLLVEGPHDLEFCARLLKPQGFSRIQSFAKLKSDHAFWLPTVPEKWPHAGDLLARHPVPIFLANPAGKSVAIVNAIGLDRLAVRLGIDMVNLDVPPDAVGIVLDADDNLSPQVRHSKLVTAIAARTESELRSLSFPSQPGVVNAGPPRCGIFILPDNQQSGTLEDVLLDASASAYPQLQSAAKSYVEGASMLAELIASDVAEYRKPAGPKKAICAAMASILKPGKSIQMSIQDNRWLDANAMQFPRVAAAQQFLIDLIA